MTTLPSSLRPSNPTDHVGAFGETLITIEKDGDHHLTGYPPDKVAIIPPRPRPPNMPDTDRSFVPDKAYPLSTNPLHRHGMDPRGWWARAYDKPQSLTRSNALLLHAGVNKRTDVGFRWLCSEYRHLAGFYFLCLMRPEVDALVPIGDAIQLGRTADALEALSEAMAAVEEQRKRALDDAFQREILSMPAGDSGKTFAELSMLSCTSLRTSFENTIVLQKQAQRDLDVAEILTVIDLAMVAYRLRNRTKQATRRFRADSRDVTCTFCGMQFGALSSNTPTVEPRDARYRMSKNYTADTNHHTIPCGLWQWWHLGMGPELT